MSSEIDKIKNHLIKQGIEPSASIVTLSNRADLSFLTRSLNILCHYPLLTKDTYELIILLPDWGSFYLALRDLTSVKLLTNETIQKLLSHPDFLYFQGVLFNLKQSSLLNLENFNWVYLQTQVVHLSRALSVLRRAGMLNQANFAALLAAEHRFLLSDFAYVRIWERLSPDSLALHWLRLLEAARQENPAIWINYVLGEETLNINSRQSTHTASIHASVAESALRLKKSYANDQELKTKREELYAFIWGLEDSFQHQVIKRCLQRLSEFEYCYFEPLSGVSTLELMTLFYCAIHDESKRYGKLDDAKSALLAALYEIQRGDNIEEGDAADVPDKPICSSGSFNKLMEKLQGIHADVKIVFLTKLLLSLKLSALVKEESYAYLFIYAQMTSYSSLAAFSRLIHRVQADGVAAIWPRIESRIAGLLFAEFGKLFDMRYDHPEFHSIIESGMFSPLDHLNDFKFAIQQFVGEQAWYRQTLQKLSRRDHCLRLWDRRHTSVEAQKDFDKHYGLSFRQLG